MTTCYAGLWYLTGDIGYETSINLFAVILVANAYFGIMWITAYLDHAEWANRWVKKFRTENKFIENEKLIPYFPPSQNEHVPKDKINFLSDMLLGN